MISMMKENDKSKYGIAEYVADTFEDIKKLPKTCTPGSVCLVINTSDVYMLNNKKEWKML